MTALSLELSELPTLEGEYEIDLGRLLGIKVKTSHAQGI